MASLRVTGWDGVERGLGRGPLGVSTVTTTGASALVAGIAPAAEVLTFFGDAAHFVSIGAGADALDNAKRLFVPANIPTDVRITAGDPVAVATA